MRYPGPYSLELLADILFGVGFDRAAIEAFLEDQALNDVAGDLPAPVARRKDIDNAVNLLGKRGKLTPDLVDALEAEPPLTPLTDDFHKLRISLEFIDPIDTLLSPAELDRVKHAARAARLHQGLAYSRLKSRLPAAVRRHACRVVGDDAGQLDAWFDGANRQVVGPGDDVRMLNLLKVAIDLADNAGKAALEKARARVDSTVLFGAIAEFRVEERGELQQVVLEFGIAVDANEFFTRGWVALGRICKISMGNDDFGTGFLIGPDLVLTNYHVMQQAISGMRSPEDVRLTFDFRREKGQELSGPRVKLAIAGASDANPTPWLIDSSPMTEDERQGRAADIDQATSDEFLDFALCRIDVAIGDDNGPHGGPRGHFSLYPPGPEFAFTKGTALTVIGHPTSPENPLVSRPQVFAIEPDSVIAVNPSKTRVRYRTNTLKGSSGSPVLSPAWQLVALHHYGKRLQYNQGIPIAAIAKRQRVMDAIIGANGGGK